MGCANSGWGALIFDEIQISENLRGRLFYAKIFGRFAPVFVDLPLKTAEISKFPTPKCQFFGRFAPKMLGGANSARGALIFTGFSKSEIVWGALILNEKSPEMAGGRSLRGGGYFQ